MDKADWTVRPALDFDSDAWNSDAQAVKIGIEIVPKIIEENGGAMARDILCDKIEGKGVSRRTAYRRIEEAEKLKQSSSTKEKTAISCINRARIVPWHDKWHRGMTNQQTVPVPFPIGGWHWHSDAKAA